MNIELGSVIDRKYELLEPLAEGGMGSVYRARHVLTEERVALKILNVGPADESQARRFKLEVSIAAKVRHPAIVKVRDAGVELETGRFYIAMELLEGRDLRDALDGGADPAAALRWLVHALDAIAAAHEQNVIHRDLKPDNLFIERTETGERVRVLDFGIARDISGPSTTTTGVAVGTALYMSPEQATAAKDISPASDVWAFGAMIYEVLAGRPPFDGPNAHAVVIGAVTEPHKQLTELRPDLDGGWSELVDRCLAKRAGDRPAARELAAALQTLLDSSAPSPGPTLTARRPETRDVSLSAAFPLVSRSPREGDAAYAMTAEARVETRAGSEAVPGAGPAQRRRSTDGHVADVERAPPPPPPSSWAPLLLGLAAAVAVAVGLAIWFSGPVPGVSSAPPVSQSPPDEPPRAPPAAAERETAAPSLTAGAPAGAGAEETENDEAPSRPAGRRRAAARRSSPRSVLASSEPAPATEPASDPEPERPIEPEPQPSAPPADPDPIPAPPAPQTPAPQTPAPQTPAPRTPAPRTPAPPDETRGSRDDRPPSGVLQGTDAFDRQAGRR